MKQVSIVVMAALFLAYAPVAQGQYIKNPILAGFYPDPSICRSPEGYFLVTSSFAYFPGLPIFHSTDLVHWEDLGGVLQREEQLNLTGAGVSRGLFAPSISYHKGQYYVVCTLVDRGGNFVVTTTDPRQQNWSNPVWLPEVDGIDPSLFFDSTSGKAYIVYNSIPPNGVSLYDGHRTIRMMEFDPVRMTTVGKPILLINGGTDISKKPVWIEAPHIFQHRGWYYLICAEGGTAYEHSEVVFRTRSLQAPFIPFSGNPILTQRHLDPNRPNPVTTAGHADFTTDAQGNWWAVFLACRPYTNDNYVTGRETFMAPVAWQDDWPIIALGAPTVQYQYPMPVIRDSSRIQFERPVAFRDEFNEASWNTRYASLRAPIRPSWATRENGLVKLKLQPSTCRDSTELSFVGFRQPHLFGSVRTKIRFQAKAAHEQAGLLVFQNERHYYFLSVGLQAGKPVVQLEKGPGITNKNAAPSILASQQIADNGGQLELKIEAKGNTYAFSYRQHGQAWKELIAQVPADFLTTNVAKGFVGCMYAMYATSNGRPSSNEVEYDRFEVYSEPDLFEP